MLRLPAVLKGALIGDECCQHNNNCVELSSGGETVLSRVVSLADSSLAPHKAVLVLEPSALPWFDDVHRLNTALLGRQQH